MGELVAEIVGGLTAGLANLSVMLGGGISSFVSHIFYNTQDDKLTTFGAVIVVFAGVSLAIGLSRWVLNFCTSLGARNR